MTQSNAVNPEIPISLPRAILIYCLVSLFLFFEMMVQVSPSVIAPQLMHDLSIGAFGLGLMSGFYFYTYTLMQIPSGLMFDQYNPRLIITISLGVCVVGTLMFALANNIFIGILARLLMGAGSAFAFVAVLVVTADLFKAKYFAAITGVTQMLAALGAMSGQLPISLLVVAMGWRASMYLLVIAGIILLVLIWMLLNYKKPRELIPLNSSQTKISQDLRQIFAQPQTWIIAVYACLLWAPMSGFTSLWGVLYLQHHYHYSLHQAAFLCSLMWLGLAFASPLLGMISTRWQKRKQPLILSALLGTCAFLAILIFPLSKFLLIVALLFAGAACSGQALSFTVVKEINSQQIRATAIAVNNMAVVLSGAIFQPLIGYIVQWGQTYHAQGYQYGAVLIFLCYFIATLISAFAIKESYR
ncbi:MAG: MFS transporter [Pseudomonadota bacterium]